MDVPDQGIEPQSPTLQVDALPSEAPGMELKTKPFALYVNQSWN